EGTDFWNLDDESTVSLNNFFLQKNQADRLESFLAKEVAPLAYRHSSASGRPEPRLIAWFGPDYSYSGRQLRSNGPIPSGLQPLLESVETATGKRFNSVLVNVYQNGSQFVGWHADDEAVLGERPFIASVSIGCTRTFELKANLLTMSGDCQANFFHRIPPQHHKRGRRFNLTFRWTHEDPNTGATGASLAPSAPSATKTATPNTAVPLTASMAPVDLDESAQSAEH
uniref:Fe2OG dioxygenase domain-containing protein n=1 Tax=Macrostomum lignano TaxID=282301 RepID=A0A1I8GH21_9PLAT